MDLACRMSLPDRQYLFFSFIGHPEAHCVPMPMSVLLQITIAKRTDCTGLI
jgi:hypothetical protein